MLLKKTMVQGLLLWLIIFISTLTTQLWLSNSSTVATEISASQINLIKNASLPIFLSDNREAASRQLESLIQETNIREIRIYGTDQRQIATVLNSKAPTENTQTLTDSFPVAFQGSLAGSVQLEISHPSPPGISWPNALGNSLLAASMVLLITAGVFVFLHYRNRPRDRFSSQPEVLEPSQRPSGEAAGSSLLIYIFPVVDTALKDNTAALDEAIASLYQRLENLVQGYGGRVLSLSNNRFICRMPSGQSSNDNLQALLFTWGIARPVVFRFENQQYRIDVKTLLHKTAIAARQGTLYPAIAEINDSLQATIRDSGTAAHISQVMKNSLDRNIEMEFSPIRAKSSTRFWCITQVKPSLAMLWRKQESSLANRWPANP